MRRKQYTGPVPKGTNSSESKKERKKVKSLSRVRLFVTPWTVTYQAPPSMGFSRQEYWSGLPFPSQGDLPDPEIEPASPVLQPDSLPLSHQGNFYHSKKNFFFFFFKMHQEDTFGTSTGTFLLGLNHT